MVVSGFSSVEEKILVDRVDLVGTVNACVEAAVSRQSVNDTLENFIFCILCFLWNLSSLFL